MSPAYTQKIGPVNAAAAAVKDSSPQAHQNGTNQNQKGFTLYYIVFKSQRLIDYPL
ncbi:hypothetical protein MASR2M70_11610 [Bacillota bacterium]